MAETKKEELDLEEFEVKEKIVSSKEEIFSSSTVEETFTEKTVIKGNLQKLLKALNFPTEYFKMFYVNTYFLKNIL